MSEQGSQFKNKLIRELAKEFHSRHHFTTAYSPWENGSVERVCREVRRTCTDLCSEWELAPMEWPAVIESVQSIFDHAPLKRLGVRQRNNSSVYRSLLEVFTGQLPRHQLLRALPIQKYKDSQTDEVCARQLIDMEML